MLEKFMNLAEQLARQGGGMSRRGFLGWVGRCASAIALAAGGLLLAAPRAKAGPHHHCADNSGCGRRHYCYTGPGNCDAEGYCTERPQVCFELYIPVCGCDGRTYTNSCFAAMAGVNVAYSGVC